MSSSGESSSGSYRGSIESTPTPQRKVGRYVQHYLLGRGGMGSVFLSRLVGARGFERWVAVKQLHVHLADDPETVNMFLDEARTSARLNHSSVVQVTDFGVEGKVPYLVMEYINGENLSLINHRCRKAETHVPFLLAARIVAWVCDGLHHAHELRSTDGEPLNLVHRDVSPQNILVSYDGAVKITDFGIAKVAHRSAVHTKTGQVKGKIAYLAPEQVLHAPTDRRTDIFALGVVLYETTVGQRLFRSDNEFDTMRRITEGDVPSPSSFVEGYPEELERIVKKALMISPDERYQTARALQQDIESYIASSGRPIGTVEVAEYMEGMFGDRMTIRTSKLRAIPDEDFSGPTQIPELVTPSSGSLKSRASTSSLPPRARSPLWVFVAIVAALCLGVLVTWTAMRDGGEPDRGDGAPTELASTVQPDLPSTDAGRPRVVPINGDASTAHDERTAEQSSSDTGAVTETGADSVELDSGPPQEKRPVKRPPRKVSQKATPSAPPGTVSIITTPWCDVYIGGARLGRTPIIRRQVPSGRHTLRFLPLGKQPAINRSIVVRPGQETPINISVSR